ncbi:protein C19orf12 [Eurytemora carolleeae]|uniref:protein C19orf12 n=1 Tax=Eurytemora carolleeae TaxID=1294199 RepID=UPI000C77BFF0|nr:protein C19orf12 [Eurytemora carolleeae]XP_023324920.1 protein C19orf12 [Eurytemora carolleeae]XP_023324921.1 protein C19orf12 [Eurytemora carolleeae]XP_023324922.1 protein C19orf12 [Eurytemora carolleeae]|eukprot:XP_023324919.1 protein C19orf12-like [Eurytemora affinis]
MVVRYRDILELLTVLSDEKGIQVTLRQSLKGGLITGSIASICAFILGPAGLAVGGAVGGVIAAYTADTFRPVSQVMQEMTYSDQERLALAVRSIISNLDAGDALELIALVQGNELLKARVMGEMLSFLRSQMNFNIPNDF